MQNFNLDTKQNINPQGEKADLLKREDIRTMQKDVMKLRELDAQKERERVAAIKIAEKTATQQVVPPPPFQQKPIPQAPTAQFQHEIERVVEKVSEKSSDQPTIPVPPFRPKPTVQIPIPPQKEKPSVSIMPEPPKKISQIQKILVRIVIIILTILALGFIYWYFFVKTSGRPEPEPVATTTEPIVVEEGTTTEPIIPEIKEIVIYPALVKTVATETIEIASSSELVSLIPELMKRPFKLGFTRILIKNVSENRLLGLDDLFQIMGVETPDGFFEKMNLQGTLVVYAAKNQNRLGFIAETNDPEGLYKVVSSWETTMEKDMEAFYLALGKTGPPATSYFRQTVYKKGYFRYLYFPPANFGICWSISNNYFIWTTSGESATKAMDALIQ